MNDESPTRRPFQFGLRKLLLWTTAVALYFGILKTLEFDAGLATVLTSWIAVVGTVRGFFGPFVAAIISIAIGTLGGLIVFCAPFALGGTGPQVFVLLTIVMGWAVGGIIFGLVEYTICAVDWADKMMQGKAVDERKS